MCFHSLGHFKKKEEEVEDKRTYFDRTVQWYVCFALHSALSPTNSAFDFLEYNIRFRFRCIAWLYSRWENVVLHRSQLLNWKNKTKNVKVLNYMVCCVPLCCSLFSHTPTKKEKKYNRKEYESLWDKEIKKLQQLEQHQHIRITKEHQNASNDNVWILN